MALKLANKKALDDYLNKYAKRAEMALVREMEYLLEEAINHAKLNKGYADQTSNLKGSIGGCVLKDGKIISYTGFVKEGKSRKGLLTGYSFMKSLASEVGKGYVILMVAGMEYATYVENFRGKNVLKKTELYIAVEIPKMMDELKNTIKSL